MQSPISLFFSYSHKDTDLRNELETHLSTLRRSGKIAAWHDRQITAGKEWAQEINHYLEAAQIILLLVSADFIASYYCYEIEMDIAIKRHEAGTARVIPIILRPTDWEDTPLGKLQALPMGAKAVTQWTNQDEAFLDIVREIRRVAEELTVSIHPAPPKLLPSLWVHGWAKRGYDGAPTVELDWTEYFDIKGQPRRIADQMTWEQVLFPQLEKAREHLPMGTTIDVRGLLPLSAALAIGTQFPYSPGYTFQVQQRTTGQDALWRSNVQPSDATFKVVQTRGKSGDQMLLALSISGSAEQEILQLFEASPDQFDSVVYAEPVSGTGERAIATDADAVALAIRAKELIQQYRNQYNAKCTHLVLYCPMGFALFLGQRLRVVGDVVTYERVADRVYQSSVRLSTG